MPAAASDLPTLDSIGTYSPGDTLAEARVQISLPALNISWDFANVSFKVARHLWSTIDPSGPFCGRFTSPRQSSRRYWLVCLLGITLSCDMVFCSPCLFPLVSLFYAVFLATSGLCWQFRVRELECW